MTRRATGWSSPESPITNPDSVYNPTRAHRFDARARLPSRSRRRSPHGHRGVVARHAARPGALRARVRTGAAIRGGTRAFCSRWGRGSCCFSGGRFRCAFEQGGEFVGGCLLIALGLVVGWLTVSGRLYVHAHVHECRRAARPQPLAPPSRPPAFPSSGDSHRCCPACSAPCSRSAA